VNQSLEGGGGLLNREGCCASQSQVDFSCQWTKEEMEVKIASHSWIGLHARCERREDKTIMGG
jgi:hypothetical protein